MTSQLIYVTLDLRRSLFVSEACNSMIICSYSSDLLPMMRKRGVKIWCFEELFPKLDLPKTSAQLLSHGKTRTMLRALRCPLRFLVFKPSNRVRELCNKNGWELVSPNIETCRNLEDKITFTELARKFNIPIPKSEFFLWDQKDISTVEKTFGKKFVVQGRIGHAGSCTWICDHGAIKGPVERGGIKPGSRVKISEFIEGPTFTVNGYASPKGKLVISSLFAQLMHVAQWNQYEMGTVGISPIDLEPEKLVKLRSFLLKLSPLFQGVCYSGFFGLDFMWNGEQWLLIEINPRFTASVSLQCFLDRVNQRYPILLYHAEQSEPPENRFDFLAESVRQDEERCSERLERSERARSAPRWDVRGKRKILSSVCLYQFGHIILRNTRSGARKLGRTLKSGIYQLTEGEWGLRSRDYDAASLTENELLLILAHKPGTWVEPGSDFATVVYKGSALDEESHLKDLFFDFDERVIRGYSIREKDLWKNQFAKVPGCHPDQVSRSETRGGISHFFIFKNPLPDMKNPDAVRKNRSSEVFENEVIKLLGEHQNWYLIEKAGGLRRWLHKDVSLIMYASEDEFELPGRLSTDANSFFQKWLGKKYVYGGNSEEGIDCSAFVQRYFWEVKAILLPKYSQDQKEVCKKELNLDELQDDDLIFMHSKKKKIPHVGIFRRGRVWHASLEAGVVEEALEDLKKRYVVEGFRKH